MKIKRYVFDVSVCQHTSMIVSVFCQTAKSFVARAPVFWCMSPRGLEYT